jgi:type I restriction enzyme M protein
LPVATTKAAQESGIVEDALYHIPRSLMKDDAKLLRPGDILISTANSLNLLGRTTHVRKVERPISFGAFMSVIRPNGNILDGYLIHCLRTAYAADFFLRNANTTTNISNLNLSTLAQFLIPLPPLEVQKEIVAEIEGYQKVIDGARAVVDNYRPHVSIHPDWPVVELGEVIRERPKNGYSGKPVDRVTDLRVLSLSATTSGTLDLTKFKYLDEHIPHDAPCRCRKGDIYLQRGNTAELVGTAALFDVQADGYVYPDLMIRIRADEQKVLSKYLLVVLHSSPVRDYLMRNAVGAAGSMPKINQGIVERIPVPLPPLATQQTIVAEIEAEQALVNGNRELAARFEKKIQAALARVWGEDGPALAEA